METQPRKPDANALRFLQKTKAIVAENLPVEKGDLLVRKLKTIVRCFDFDGNGTFNRKDLDLMVDKVADSKKATDVERKKLHRQAYIILDMLYGEDTVDAALTPDEMAERLMRRDRDQLVATVTYLFTLLFEILDVNDECVMGRSEFHNFHKIFGVFDEVRSNEIFDALDENKNGSLSFMEFLQGGIDYFVSNDENSPYNLLLGPLAV